MLKAIIFDIDGVLVDSREANIALIQTLLTTAGYPAPSREECLAGFHLPMWQNIERLTKSKDQQEIKRIWEMGHNLDIRGKRNHLFNFPENLEPTLKKLHKKYKLAIVTSRIRIGVEEIFNIREIKEFFDVVVAFEDYKNPKPHPEPLEVALNKLNINANEAVYVGDSHTDIESAKAAHMKVIHLADETHADATLGIRHFDELVEVIKKI